MRQIVYRGVEYGEAWRVVRSQRYERDERRRFINGASAKAVFGTGVYLVSNPEVAAQYAICHAETVWDKAAILRQEVDVTGLFCLDERYGENELRTDALRNKHSAESLEYRSHSMGHQEWLEWTGEEVRTYLLAEGYKGLQYRISPELTYYVCYQPEVQIYEISIVSVLDLREFT
ncbi:hypothetical protein [Brevibacillus choshinensis]|uniref:RES domain-containing protein n=1 Tax=Brevibacillus choshinensis TaxID=54911 RepID=A0ABX7FGJ4_BRECH|nr:hypothetical protein [Brevibacillus choshinensis]QRG65311.1 hypothetical protein JNE38_16900 [Brevibacillus choshinensis]